MPTLTVKEYFDVIKNIAAGFFPRSIEIFLYPLVFQHVGNIFSKRIIMPVTEIAHAAIQTVRFQERMRIWLAC